LPRDKPINKETKKYFKNITSATHDGLNKYQQNIMDKVFPENGGDSKEDKGILIVPSQHSYYVKQANTLVPFFNNVVV